MVKIVSSSSSVVVIVTTNLAHEPQLLCWRIGSSAIETCLPGSGTWRVRLHHVGRLVFVLRLQGRIVARKTVTVALVA
jgi:hypothetical protein